MLNRRMILIVVLQSYLVL